MALGKQIKAIGDEYAEALKKTVKYDHGHAEAVLELVQWILVAERYLAVEKLESVPFHSGDYRL